MKPEQYTYIAAWRTYLGSDDYYIKEQQQQAAEDNAPADALFKRIDGSWFCRSNVPTDRHALVYALDRDVASRRVER